MYQIKKHGNGKENTYIYDEETDTVFKIPQTKIGGKVYHSYECAIHEKGGTGGNLAGGSNSPIEEETIIANVDGIYYYAPDLKGFSGKETSVVYYSETDLNSKAETISKKEISLASYIANGQHRQITDGGETYTFHNYGESSIWANVKCTANGNETWWVWIPRYAYKSKICI